MKTALTIAGFDPIGGAGLQADLKVFNAFGIYGFSIVSAITAQNSMGINSLFPVDKDIIKKQLEVLLSDIRPNAVKIGMIYKNSIIKIISKVIKGYSLNNLVIDPIAISSSGVSLVEDGTLNAIKEILFPLSRVITPNIYEASLLTGISIKTIKEMEKAALLLKNMGPEIVIITGGHLDKIACDLYYDGEIHIFEDIKIKGKYHGTGCTFSAAITALLALNISPLEAAQKAKLFVKNAIEKAYHPGKGMGLLYI